jgi:hypothetical protein
MAWCSQMDVPIEVFCGEADEAKVSQNQDPICLYHASAPDGSDANG